MAAPQLPAAVVTGANRGLGLELCRQLQQLGWPVLALCCRTSPELEVLAAAGRAPAATSDASSGAGGNGSSGPPGAPPAALGALTVVEGVDVAEEGCTAVVERALAGVQVGLLILNAGILGVDSLAELDIAAVRQQFEVNALGPLRVAHAVLPHLVSSPAAAAAPSQAAAPLQQAAAPAGAGAGPAALDAVGSSGGGHGGAAAGSSAADSSADVPPPELSPSLSGPARVTAAAPEAGSSAGVPLPCATAPARVGWITSKIGSVALTRQGGKNGSVGYRLSKAAANMASQLLAIELAPRGIPVLTIHPGAVRTDMYMQYWAAVGAGGSAGAGGMAPSAHGSVSVQEAAAGVLARLAECGVEGSGRLVQATTGAELPW